MTMAADMAWLDACIDLGVATGIHEPGDEQHIRAVFVTRGTRKGLILASAPSSRTMPERAAAWQGIISAVAPVRVNIATVCWFLPDAPKALFRRVEAWTSVRTVMRGLNLYGQHPYEFNMCDQEGAPAPKDWAQGVWNGIDTFLARRAYA
jgi:hypothetical protein